MDSRDDLDVLLGIDGVHPYAEWDLLRELDNREKRKNSPKRKAANRRAHRHSLSAKRNNQEYHRNVVSPRRKTVRAWMRAHPEEVGEVEVKHFGRGNSVHT